MDLPTTRHDQPVATKDPRTSEVRTEAETNRFETISSYILLACIFFAPLVFFPSPYAPLDTVKTVFLGAAILLAAISYAISTLRNRGSLLPRSALAYASIGIVISTFLSSLVSANFSKSFMGQGFEAGTASFIFLMFLSAFLVSRMVGKDKDVLFKIYTAVFASLVLLVVFHLVRLIGGTDFLSLGILSNLTSTVLGRWYDLAVLAAAAGLLSFFALKFLPGGKGLKRTLMAALVFSGVVLFLVDFTLVWYTLALILLGVGAYEYVVRTPKGSGITSIISRISIFTLILLVISIVCAWKGNVMTDSLKKSVGIEYREVVLPWQLTLDVTANTLKEAPLLGAGPNRFGFQYLRFKPFEVNQTPFWNSEFTSGFSHISTQVVTHGLLGLLFWCLFFIFFVRDGLRALRTATDPLRVFLATSSFFTASFLWLMSLIYIPSHTIIFFTFVFTGICAALTLGDSAVRAKSMFAENSRWKSLTPIASALALVILVVWLGIFMKKTVAVAYFQRGILELNANKSVDLAQKNFLKALSWDTSDIYYQALSEINILKINTIAQELRNAAAKNPNAALDPKRVEEVMALAEEAVKFTKKAEEIDPHNHYNYIAAARISEVAASLKIPNAYENAKASYGKALQFNPYNPGIYLSVAQLEASQNRLTDAQQYIAKALQLKPNYTEAVYFLSQIQVANNQLKDAIVSARVATEITPNEPVLFFQLGLLQYNDRDYTSAATSFEKALALNSQYANAQYFLGLSYARLGRNADAIRLFEELVKTNPENQEVLFILSNLKEGRSPFADAKAPIDSKPEKRKALPVVEKQPAKTVKK